jgi:hypothetical protein
MIYLASYLGISLLFFFVLSIQININCDDFSTDERNALITACVFWPIPLIGFVIIGIYVLIYDLATIIAKHIKRKNKK